MKCERIREAAVNVDVTLRKVCENARMTSTQV